MLYIKNLSHIMNGIELQDISFHIDKEAFCVLFGEDDAGKTEIINTIMGLSPSYQGEILYQGQNISKLPASLRRQIRFVPDGVLLLKKMKAKSYLNHMERTYKVKNTDYRQRLLEYFQIHEEQYLTNMTYEENKLTAIIGALLTKPEFLILDEPSNFLTNEKYHKLLEHLQELNKAGLTILILAETYEEVESYANCFLYLKNGKLLGNGVVNKDCNRTKIITITSGIYQGLEHIFGNPIQTDEKTCVYYTDLDWEHIGKGLKECGVKDMDVSIQMATMQKILDIALKLEQKDE